MKKLSLIIFAVVLSSAVFAQKYVPQIGIGTTFNYNAEATNMGYKSPLTLKVISMNDPMKFSWAIPALGTGSFLIPTRSLDSASKMIVRIPQSDQPIIYKNDESIMFISKSLLSGLVKDQYFTMNKTKFSVKPLETPYLINTKEAAVIYVTSENGKVKLWILNTPNFPLLVKMTGNPGGVDFDLSSIKE